MSKPKREQIKLEKLTIDLVPGESGLDQAYIRFESSEGDYLSAMDLDSEKAQLLKLKKWIDSMLSAREKKTK